jgi:hypothetical protein
MHFTLDPVEPVPSLSSSNLFRRLPRDNNFEIKQYMQVEIHLDKICPQIQTKNISVDQFVQSCCQNLSMHLYISKNMEDTK